MTRPYTTLFLLASVDGKISTGDTDIMDVDKDFPNIVGLKEGLNQYYEIEKQTDFFSLNTGKVFSKIGFNNKTEIPDKTVVSFVVVDNKPHLNHQGIIFLANKAKKLIIATTNPRHPALELKKEFENIEVILYEDKIDFKNLFIKLKNDFKAERVTVQSGGSLNAELVREDLIDRVLLVVAPALIGGKDTATLVDGESLHSTSELSKIKTLKLLRMEPLNDSYLLLEYEVKNNA